MCKLEQELDLVAEGLRQENASWAELRKVLEGEEVWPRGNTDQEEGRKSGSKPDTQENKSNPTEP